MTAAEFRLGLAAAGLLLLLGSVFAWEGHGWLRVREKPKRKGGRKRRGRRSSMQKRQSFASIDDTGMTVKLCDGKIVVASIEPGTPASKAGLRPGLVIESIAGVKMNALRANLESLNNDNAGGL